MEEDKYRIPLFDGNNYPDWKFRMTVYLDELDLLKHIETPMNQLLEDNPESRNGLVRNDKKCNSRIVQRTHDAQLEYVKGTAYDICKSLKDVFETKGVTSRVMLKTKLLSLKQQPSEETLSELFLKFDKIGRDRLHYGRHGQSVSSISEYVCGIRNDSYSIENVTGKGSETRYG
jgi:hypothetical protein